MAALERWGTVARGPDELVVDDGGEHLVHLVITPRQVAEAVAATKAVMRSQRTDAVLIDGVPLVLLDALDDVLGPMREGPIVAELVGWDFVVRPALD